MTSSQEVFCRNIVQGKTQRESLVIAYPKAKQWKTSTVDVRASSLMREKSIQAKIEELKQVEDNKIKWNRKIATEKLLNVLEMNEQEIKRISEVYEHEIAVLKEKLYKLKNEYKRNNNLKIKREIEKLEYKIIQLKKQSRTNAINSKTIYETIKLLNRMYDINKTNEDINIENEERESLKSLTVEELKAIAYTNINKK